ncbi:MAG: DUF1838 family protein [Actinomycetota bacterium]|nr:DUF1838 domain-containing protein [Actinomycetota bacterium]
MNLDDPAQNLCAFLKARASLGGEDTVTWFTGTTHAWMPAGKFAPLFGFEGYNIARAVVADGGYDLLTREAVFYIDLRSGEPLDQWANPFSNENVTVAHIWNDPVNQQLRLDGPRGPWRVPVTGIGDDLFFNVDVFLAYPSPLPRAQFPEHSQDDLYQAAELFQFFCKRHDIEDESLMSAPALVSWTRLGPWLPWMRMGDRTGQLVYHGRGAKLAGGYADLPGWIRERVEATDARYAGAPREFTAPNATSWTEFRKILEAAKK